MDITRAKIAFVLASSMLWSGAAYAGTAVLTLTRVAPLTNVADAAGLFQHEAGVVKKGVIIVGNYFLSRRVDTLAGVG